MRRFLLGLSLLVLLIAGLTTHAYADQQVVTLSDSPSGVKLLQQDDLGVNLRMDLGAIELFDVNTKGGDFTLLSVPGFNRSHKIGEPDLPTASKMLSIPFGTDLQVEVLNYETQEIDLHALGFANAIIPAQPGLSKSQNPEDVPFEINQTLYQENQVYNLPKAETEVMGTMRNVHLGLVVFSPFEYNPVKGTLTVCTSIEVRVHYLNPDWATTQEMNRKYYSPFFRPIYDKIINYQAPTTDKDDLVKYPVKYVIVSDRMFEAQLQPFIEWKTEKGFNVIVAYTDVIGSTTTAISNYLEGLYNAAQPPADPAPSFVLFVGDDQQIPATQCSGHISDLYFCEYTGDYYPEVYYGRFSAQNTALLQPQIDKTLEYEKYLMPDPSFLGDVTLVSGVDASHAPTWGNGQINYGTDYYFNAAHGIDPNVWLYPASDAAGAAAAVIQTIQNGVGFYNYTAHGSHDGLADPSFSTSDVATLTNAHKYPLLIGNCCLTVTFGDDYSTPCFGEAWVQKQNGGGFAFIGGTNSTYWDEDYWWGVGDEPVSANPVWHASNPGAYDGIFHDHGEAMAEHYITNSGIIFAGNMAVSQSTSPRKQYYWEIYTLMGDPSTMTYMGIPTENSYTLPATILITDNTITIDAEPESYIGVSRDGVLHGAGYVDSTGSVTIDIDPFTIPGEMEVVITHQDRIPVIGNVMVIAPEGPYVIYDTHDINDIAGNNDGMIDISEDILMGLQLKNVGPDDALNVSATLSTTDPYVTLTDDTESFGTILADNGTAYVADAIAFNVDPATPDGHKVAFDVTVTGDQRITWNSAFNVTVHAPDVSYVSVDVNDNTGNGNGILDAGETAELTFTLQNGGSGSAGNITGLLSEFDTFISISDDGGTFGTIAPNGGTADNSGDVFVVEADASCPQGYAMQFNLQITGDGGYTKTFIVDFTVGDRVPFFTDDFSYNQGWTGLNSTSGAEWTIGPCVGGSGSDSNGGPDPSTDHSPSADNQVLGNDLTSGTGGDYNSGLSQTYWVYSPVIDCEDYSSVQLKFYRWLGMESSSYDHAYFDVFDGSTWVRLYQNSATFDDGTWTEQYYDVSQYAEDNPNFQMRFGLGGTDGSVQYCGWNIDDIEMKGYYNGNEYKVRVAPEVQSQYGPANDVASYNLLIRNRGAFMDQFDLTYSGDWGVTFWNEAGTDQITNTDQIGSLDSGIVMIKVAIPENTPLHDFDSTLVIVTSQGSPMAADSALLITYSAGTAVLIPWSETFSGSALDMQHWFSNVGATIANGTLLPPSPPYALNLDGGVDTVTSQMLNLAGQTGARISYYYERGGNGDAPESGDNLWVEYKNNVGVWTTLAMYAGADPVMDEYEYVNLALPEDALYNGLQLRMRSAGSAAGDDDWFVDDIMIDLPPAIELNPTSISEILNAGESMNGEMTVSNVGEGSMFYNIDVVYMMDVPTVFTKLENSGQVEPASREYTPEYYTVEDNKGIDNPLVGQEVKYNAGGPDDYGYYWMDSDEAGGPAFSWVDVSATGTDIFSQLDDDNSIGPFDIGFDFPYYGDVYTQFYVGSNGIVGFAADGMSSRNELPIPNTGTPNNIIAWMWDDLDPTDADNTNGHVYYKSDGNSLVIQFVDYAEYQAAAGDVITAEIILTDKGDIKIQYLNIAAGFDVLNGAVGIENATGTDGLEVCYHTAYLHSNLAVQFSKPYEWLHFDSYAGNLLPGESDTLACLITTEEDLEGGVRTAQVNINSNDPNAFETTIPATLEVLTEAPYIVGDANGTGDINVSDAVYIINFVFVSGPAPDPILSADANCDGAVNVSDAVWVINFVFVGGNAPGDLDGDGIPDC